MSDLPKYSTCKYYCGSSHLFCAVHPSASIEAKSCDSCVDFEQLPEIELETMREVKIKIDELKRVRTLTENIYRQMVDIESLGLNEVDDYSNILKYWSQN